MGQLLSIAQMRLLKTFFFNNVEILPLLVSFGIAKGAQSVLVYRVSFLSPLATLPVLQANQNIVSYFIVSAALSCLCPANTLVLQAQ